MKIKLFKNKLVGNTFQWVRHCFSTLKQKGQLEKDSFEKALRQEVIEYGIETKLETIRLIRNNKRFNLKLIESRGSCNLADLSQEYKFKNAILIHNHNAGYPISPNDINTFFNCSCKKIVATTPNGKFSSIERPFKKYTHKQKDIIKSDIIELNKILIKKSNELGLTFTDEYGNTFGLALHNIKSEAIINLISKYAKFSIYKINAFAEKNGLIFKTDIDV